MNRKTTAIVLLILGGILIAVGFFLKLPTDKPQLSEQTAADTSAATPPFAETLIQRFNPNYFSVRPSHNAFDLELRFTLKGKHYDFALMQHWQANMPKNGVVWTTKEELEQIQKLAADEKIPVFVIIGIGGQTQAPERLFILPLKEAKYVNLYQSTLKKFERKKASAKFFYDYKTEHLK